MSKCKEKDFLWVEKQNKEDSDPNGSITKSVGHSDVSNGSSKMRTCWSAQSHVNENRSNWQMLRWAVERARSLRIRIYCACQKLLPVLEHLLATVWFIIAENPKENFLTRKSQVKKEPHTTPLFTKIPKKLSRCLPRYDSLCFSTADFHLTKNRWTGSLCPRSHGQVQKITFDPIWYCSMAYTILFFVLP